MAKKRNRSVLGWTIISILLSPIASILILLLIGEDNEV